jgi:HEAT repeat protein
MRKLIGFGCLLLLILSQAKYAPAQSPKAQALIKDLADKNPKVRAQAAVDIGDLADVRLADAKAALPKLKELQKDPDAAVRKAVIEALGKIEPEQYPTLLIDTLKTEKDPGVQLAAVQALGRLGQQAKSAVGVLVDVHKASLADKNPPKTTVPPGQNMQPADPPAVRRAILQALGQIEPDPKNRVPFMIDALKLEKDAGARTALVNALGQVGPPAKDAAPALLEVQKTSLAESAKATPTKGQPPPDPDPQNLRRSILQALARIEPDPKVHVPRLIDALKTDKAPGVRLAAVQALGQVGPPAKEAIPTLLALAKAAPVPNEQPGFRRAVADAIARIETDPKEQVSLLTDLLKSEKDPAGRLALVQALGSIGPPAKPAIPTLLEVRKASPPTPKTLDPQGVRKAILEAIGKIDPEPKTYVPIVIDFLKQDRDSAVRTAAVQTLKQIGPPAKDAIPALQEVVKSLAKSTRSEDKALLKEAEDAIKALGGGS